MATCDICARNEAGTMNFNHCVNNPIGQGCKGCSFRCGRKAFYIGGMNCCVEHLEAFNNRMLEAQRCSGNLASNLQVLRDVENEFDDYANQSD